MKPNVDTSLRTEGTLGNKRRAMTIDVESLDRMMLMLTDLYSDPEGASIREYPINALDSHKEAGVTRPIEVTLPTEVDPTFIVKDYGTGLSEYEVVEHFGKYGWSSKLDTNEQVGMMGLGCKAALTYTKQFALAATKDGLTTEVLVLRAIDPKSGREVPSIEPVSTTPTDEPNGVTVYIPVNNVGRFNRAARRFFRYWKPGDILVDGEPPEQLDGIWLDNDVLVTPEEDYGDAHTTIVMGNIPYRVPRQHQINNGITSGMNVVVWVPIGSVDPTPSREALHYTARTVEVLELAKSFVHERLHQQMQTQLDACETAMEALELQQEWSSRRRGGGHLDFTYRGRPMPRTVTLPFAWIYNTGRNSARQIEHYTMPTIRLADHTFVVGHKTKVVSARQREKIHEYLAKGELKFGHYKDLTLVPDLSWTKGWHEGATVIPWDDIQSVSNRSNGAGGKKEATVTIIDVNGVQHESIKESELPEGKLVVAAQTKIKDDYELRSFKAAMRATNYTIVLLRKNSFERFRRDHPGTFTAKQAVYRELRKLTQSVSGLQLAVGLNRSRADALVKNLLSAAQSHALHDPVASQVAKEIDAAEEQNLTRLFRSLHNAAVEIGIPPNLLLHLRQHEDASLLTELEKKYPLLTLTAWSIAVEDIANYINAMHAYQQENQA